MPTIISPNGFLTSDETFGLQNSGSLLPEDSNDNDVAISTLPTAFSTRLSQLTTSTILGAAAADNLFSVASDGQVSSLSFIGNAGASLPVYGSGAMGAASGLSAVDGGAISLFADQGSSLGGRMVLGVDTTGQIVFAIFMEPNAALTSAKVWSVQYEAIAHPDASNPDDGVVLGGLGVNASTRLDFNFNSLPSGQNLFGMVGSTASGLVVIGKVPVLNADGTFTNASNTINTSQGGGPTTIGVNNQMFDPGEGAYFTFVKNPDARYLAGAAGGLDQNEADDADFIRYSGGTLEVSGAYVKISQLQGNASATMKITAYNMDDSPQGQDFARTGLGTGDSVQITAVRVFNAAGSQVASPNVSISGGVATVGSLGAGYRVEWDTSSPHDQVLVEGVAGKFDIGGFGATDAASTSVPLNNIRFEDDGPSITASAVGAPTLTVDESNLTDNASGAFAAQFAPLFGADGAGAVPRTYALSTPGGNSGLVDTASGQAVMLSLVGGQVQGRTATGNDLVFTVSVDASGNIGLDQIRAVLHPTLDPDEAKTLSAADLVVLTATATDGDGDKASAPLNIGQLLVFEDDGPAIGPIQNSIVDFSLGSTATKTLNGVVGADPNASPYRFADDGFTSSLIVNAVELRGVLSADKQSVTYFADSSGDATFGNTGDTAYFRTTLDQAGSGAYAFEVLVNPPPSKLDFNFNSLPSGQNLLGTVGSTASGLVVIGKVPVLNADGTFTNASNTINTSQGGGPTTIGVNNQMFDPGEGAYFTFVKNPDARYLAGAAGGLDQNEADDADFIRYSGGTLEVSGAYVKVSQLQGNASATMKITAYNMDDAPQGQDFARTGLGTGDSVQITAVRVYNAAGNQVASPNVSISGGVATVGSLGAGYRVEWDTSSPHDQVLIEGVAGKFDIGGFGATQAAPTPDAQLDFVVRVTDGDGDINLAGFSIGIDGTGIYDDGVVAGVSTASALAMSMSESIAYSSSNLSLDVIRQVDSPQIWA